MATTSNLWHFARRKAVPSPPPLNTAWHPTTVALLVTYAVVLLTIAVLYWRVHQRLASRAQVPRTAAPVAAPVSRPRLEHSRSNLCELSEMTVQATPRQRAHYAELCVRMVQDACAYIEPEGSSRHVEWRRCADVNGVRVSLARLPESPIVLIKGSVAVRVTDIGKIASYFAHIDSTAAMRHSLEKLDPMFRDGRVICRLPTSSSPPPPREGAGGKLVVRSAPVAGEEPTGRTQVEWACFDAPPPLAPRDFCWLEHSSYARTPGGSLLFLSLCTSVEREEAPDMWNSHGYVRAALTSTGYIFKQTDEASEEWELSYVVQIDPKGIIPTWVVNLVATDQASNAAAMRDAVAERLLAEEALRSPARGPEEKGAGSSAEQGWASVPLQEALLARDGGSAVVSLGQLASGRTVEWRWMAGSEAQAKHAHVSCQLEMAAVSVAGPDGVEAKGGRHLPARREDALEHEAERAADHATPAGTARVHTCRAHTRASAQHWIKFRRTRTLLERLHWSGTRPLTIFLQVRQL